MLPGQSLVTTAGSSGPWHPHPLRWRTGRTHSSVSLYEAVFSLQGHLSAASMRCTGTVSFLVGLPMRGDVKCLWSIIPTSIKLVLPVLEVCLKHFSA